jgi:NAD(P)-dependent dehydrogenase (short-subunit alcohol dehydrogenase family)
MNFPSNPRALITGAGSGLGRAFALDLAKQGGRILVADINMESAEETVRLVRDAGGEAESIACDVSNPADLTHAANEIQRLWDGIDILVNNAGVAAGGLMGEIPLEDWSWIMNVNLWGVIHGCHVFAPIMKVQKRGFIINVASSAGLASLPEMASYNVTKAGVIALSETLYTELAPYGISVAALCPTFFKTNLLKSFRSVNPRQKHLAQAFFDRSGATAEGIAQAALEGIQKGKLIIIPQADGKLMWRMKRLSPQFYFKQVLKQYTGGLFDKLANRASAKTQVH